MDEDLLPCPFCGQTNVQLAVEFIADPQDIAVFVRCNTCGGRGAGQPIETNVPRGVPSPHNLIADIEQRADWAVSDWNMRAKPCSSEKTSSD